MNRLLRSLFAISFAGLLPVLPASAAGAASPLADALRRPNFLFILADDYGIRDVGIEGSSFYETPNLDRLAGGGMRFTRGYAAGQVCSPSRASILLGQYPARHGITDYLGAQVGRDYARERHARLLVPDYVRQLPAADTTLAEALKAGGYVTFLAGKWHLGGKGSWPEDHGFDINQGGWDAGSPSAGYYPPWRNPKLPDGPPGESLTLRLAAETMKFMETRQDRPFLAYLSFYAVHSPLQTSRALWQKYRDKAARQPVPEERFALDGRLPVRVVQDHPVYAGLIEEMDTAIGRVLRRLEELGLADRTVVIFTSDNGGVVSGDAYSSSQLPLRGGKGRQWEGGLRVPLYIRAPGVTRPGATCDTPVISMDFYPTILELAGLPLLPRQHVDGVSLVPLLRGGRLPPRPLFWHYPHYGNQGGNPSSVIRKDGWKLIHYWEDGRNELYDLGRDPGERNDLAARESARAGLLWAELKAWMRQTDARAPLPNPEYQESWAEEGQARALTLKKRLEKTHAEFLQPEWQPDPTWWGSLPTGD